MDGNIATIDVVRIQYSMLTPQSDEQRDLEKAVRIIQQNSERQSLLSSSSSHGRTYKIYATDGSCCSCCCENIKLRLCITAMIVGIIGSIFFFGVILPMLT